MDEKAHLLTNGDIEMCDIFTPLQKGGETMRNNANNATKPLIDSNIAKGGDDNNDDVTCSDISKTSCQEALTIFLFCFMNFLNYVNRYTTPPIVGRLKTSFQVDDTSLGMIQSGFEICYVVTAPLFGFLGDRWKRKYIMSCTLLLSTISDALSSFVPDNWFYSLLITRSLLGIAEAGYTNICPSIIGDLFIGRKRTIVLTVYQFAIPLGCGVGYLASGTVADLLDSWRWAFRITPLPMFLSALCLIAFFREPQRGQAERAVGKYDRTDYCQDISYLAGLHSFVMTSLGFVCASFATGALCYWTPEVVLRMFTMQRTEISKYIEAEIGTTFGVIISIAGIFGVAFSVVISNMLLKPSQGLAADGIVCGAGMLICGPIMYFCLIYVEVNLNASWFLIFFGIALLSSNLVLVAEITLNVVIPTRRATAESFQTTISHLFGDATAPYVTGYISDALRMRLSGARIAMRSDVINYKALQYSLFLTSFVMVISGGFFLFGSLYINQDAIIKPGIQEQSHEDKKDEIKKSYM